jgi:hypothetical protein
MAAARRPESNGEAAGKAMGTEGREDMRGSEVSEERGVPQPERFGEVFMR